MNKSLYLPYFATICDIRDETPDTSTFCLTIDNPKIRESFKYYPGQFAELSVFGVGECPISITSTPTKKGILEFCIRAVGTVTSALHELIVGDKVGIRGPLGNSFPIDKWKCKNLLFIGGGIGLAPLRSSINFVLNNRKDFGLIDIIYGARDPSLLCFRSEYNIWAKTKGVNLHLTVDKGDAKWKGKVGLVPDILKEVNILPENRIAITCGPPIMIKFVLANLVKMGYKEEDIFTTLELKMKCGVGKCGRCNIGEKYVCQDGPVFSLAELKHLSTEY